VGHVEPDLGDHGVNLDEVAALVRRVSEIDHLLPYILQGENEEAVSGGQQRARVSGKNEELPDSSHRFGSGGLCLNGTAVAEAGAGTSDDSRTGRGKRAATGGSGSHSDGPVFGHVGSILRLCRSLAFYPRAGKAGHIECLEILLRS
jgi:hypothetical protein